MHAPPHPHTIHGERLIVCCFSVPRCVPFRVSILRLALLFPLLPVLCPEPLLPYGQRQGTPPPIEESCSLAEFTPPTGFESMVEIVTLGATSLDDGDLEQMARELFDRG